LNQQQLQVARAALWRHSNPLVTFDDAAAWLDEIGLCLFLPRPAQLPAPAPSFAEAVMGTPSAAPPPQAIRQATELVTRLISAGRAIALNLLGTISDQPDSLITPEVLPWVAAIRGDRQWKSAPAGRTAPIVVRTWAMLDEHGPRTAVEIRELLGRELTEAAVLRALVELWTTIRAAPTYADGEPTRWSLLKTNYTPQLTTAANTALPTALSALLSIYLRSAVAATAEEAEIFLSPLTARSRIREVLHGMTAARRFGSLSLGSHTLLFVEGSLPETPVGEPATEAEPTGQTSAPRPAPRRERPMQRPPFRRESAPRRDFSDKRPPFRDRSGPRPSFKQRAEQPRGREFPPRRDERPPFRGNRPASKFPPREERPRFQRRDDVSERPRREDRPAAKFPPRRDDRPRFQGRDDASERPRREDRPAAKFPPRGDNRPWQKDRRKSWAKPGDRRREGAPPRFSQGDPRESGFAPRRKPFGGKPGFAGKPKFQGVSERGPRNERRDAQGPDARRPGSRPGGGRPFTKGNLRSRPPQKPRSDGPPRIGQGSGKGKPYFGKGKGKPGFGPGPSSRKNFSQTSAPRNRKPRKNRSQEESSE
jgi:23S rRNA pseudouridine2605 synthase